MTFIKYPYMLAPKFLTTLASLLLTITLSAQITYEAAFPNLNFQFPIELQSSQDGTDRMFVVEQPGRIKVFDRDENALQTDVTTFLDITDRVSFSSGQEIGLLGLAFHPNYEQNGYFYVYYLAPGSLFSYKIVLSRFTVNSGNPNLADSGSEVVIFQFEKNQNASNHNGGKIAFGLDGYLYISLGDGGGANDPQGNGQDKDIAFGSICRIDIDVDGNNPVETNPDTPNGNYEIPSDNPFVNEDGLDEIYAYGIRNTWKFSFDKTNGTLWGADVGQNAFEEINIIENGGNYGWKRFEGSSVANSGTSISEPTIFPVFVYNRSQNDVSITGGYVYRGSEITSLSPDIYSKYIYGDFVSGRVWALDYNATTGDTNNTLLFRTSGESISSFGVDKNGELYFSDYGSSVKIYKLVDGTTEPSGNTINGIGEWANLNGGTINGEINTIATATDGSVYHGGNFNLVGSSTINNIGVWNETTGWQDLQGGTDGVINSISIASNGNVYAAGVFNEIGGVSANNIAVWDGNVWAALGSGIEGSVAALVIDTNNNVYVGGSFEAINGTQARNIAMWNGTSWSSLVDTANSISGTNNEIRALAIDNNNILYVGGNFDEAGGVTANRIATWDGSNWSTLGNGTSGFVQAIAATNTDIYIGGNFSIAGGLTVNRIAKWDKNTSSWSALNNGLSNVVNEIIHDGTNLYAAGNFNLANNTSNDRVIVNNIAQWNETAGWRPLGTNTNVGVDIKLNSIQFSSNSDGINKIFAGGNFTQAGSSTTENVAQWTNDDVLGITDVNPLGDLYIYPNPTSSKVYLSRKCVWSLTDALGRAIKSDNSDELSIIELPAGLYFLNLGNSTTFKVIKE